MKWQPDPSYTENGRIMSTSEIMIRAILAFTCGCVGLFLSAILIGGLCQGWLTVFTGGAYHAL